MELKNPLWYPFTDEDYEDSLRQIQTWMSNENRTTDDPISFTLNWIFERLTSEAHDYSGVLRQFDRFSEMLLHTYKIDQSSAVPSLAQFGAYRSSIEELDQELSRVIADTKRRAVQGQLMRLQNGLRHQFGVAAVLYDRATAVTHELFSISVESVKQFPAPTENRFLVIHHFLPLAALRDSYVFTQSKEALSEFLEMADYLLALEQLGSIRVGNVSPRADELEKYMDSMKNAIDKLEVAALMEGLL